MKIRDVAAWSCLTAVMAFGVAACGDDDSGGDSGGSGSSGDSGGGSLNVYSSLPLQGASRPQSEDVINGIKLALKQKGNKCGDFNIKYTRSTTPRRRRASGRPGQTSANARKVAQDDNAIAYIGEFNSGASAISIPITNEAGILQVSPSNTALGLTKGGAGAEPGEPDKYYPSGERNYGRVVPIDTIQGAAQAQYMKDEGVKNVYILDDAEVYGKGVAKNTQAAAEKLGIKIAGNDSWDGKAANYRALADKIKATGADAVFTGGIIDNNAPQLYKDLNAAMPDAKLFGPDGVATVDFTKEIPAEVQKQTYLTVPTTGPGRAAARRPAVLQGLRGRVRRAAGRDRPVRRLRLRGDGRRLRRDRPGRRRPQGRHRRLLRAPRAVRARWARTTSTPTATPR